HGRGAGGAAGADLDDSPRGEPARGVLGALFLAAVQVALALDAAAGAGAAAAARGLVRAVVSHRRALLPPGAAAAGQALSAGADRCGGVRLRAAQSLVGERGAGRADGGGSVDIAR